MNQLKKINNNNWILEENTLEFKISKFSEPKNGVNVFSAIIHDNYTETHIMNITGFFSLMSIETYCRAFACGYDCCYVNHSKENLIKEK